MVDIIVDDDFIKKVSTYVKNFGTDFDKCYSDYVKITEEYASNGANSGQLSDAISEYIEVAKLLKSKVTEITTAFSGNLDSFLVDFDDADSYLY